MIKNLFRTKKPPLPQPCQPHIKPVIPQGGAIRLGGGDASIVIDPNTGAIRIQAQTLDIQCSGPITLNGIRLEPSQWMSLLPKKETQMVPTQNLELEPTASQDKPNTYVGDLQKTALIDGLFKSPGERDAAWRQSFLENVADASFACGDPQVIEGPDGRPYFVLKTPESGKHFQCFVLRHLLDHLLEHGLGVAFNPEGNSVDWIFNYGQIFNFHIKGEFHSPQAEETEDQQLMVGTPSETLLPDRVRGVLRRHFASWGIEDVRVSLATHFPGGRQELVFVVDQSLLSQNQRLQALMEHLNWYTPSFLDFNLTGSAHPNFQNATPL